MKIKHRLISLFTSFALACGLAVNAAAAAPNVAEPTITLTAANGTASVQVGQEISLAANVSGTMAGLTLNAPADGDGLTLEVVSVGDTGFANANTPQKQADGAFPALVLYGSANVSLSSRTVAIYTFKAEKAGSYTVSLSGSYSDANGTEADLTKTPSLAVTVSARALTADASRHAALTGTYGATYSELAKNIRTNKVTFTSGSETVSVKGSWSYAGSGDHPAAGDSSAEFTFTPSDPAYAPATAVFQLSIQPKKLTPVLTVKPSVKMFDGSSDLAEDQQASLSLQGIVGKDDVSASFAKIAYNKSGLAAKTITASGISLTGSDIANYTLSADSCSAKGSITPYTGEVTVETERIGYRSYTGSSQPITAEELVLKLGKNTLTEDTDYTITYSVKPVGSQNEDTVVTYTVKGTGRYEGCTFRGSDTLTGSFTIYKLPLPSASGTLGSDITLAYQETYTAPDVSAITLNNAQGALSLRYCAAGSGDWSETAPTMPGTYRIAVWYEGDGTTYGSGILTDIPTITLTIQKLAGSGSVTMQGYTYGDAASTPTAESSTNGTDAVSYHYTGTDCFGTNYDSDTAPVNAGSYTVTAAFAATDIYEAASDTVDFTVSPKALTQNDFTLSASEFTYNGAVQQPKLNTSLHEGTDYTADLPDSQDTGDYTLTVTGQGNYTGSVTFSYAIQRAEGTASVTMQGYTYGDTPSQPQPASDTNGTNAVTYRYTGKDYAGADYDSDAAPVNAGSYTVTASFAETANAAACTAAADFTVSPKGIVADQFQLENASLTYNGSQQQPTVKSESLAAGDYTASTPESTNAGSYELTVTGQGNYTGSVKLAYTISPAVYTLPAGASVSTELSEYPLSIYGGQALSLVNLQASGLPESARFGWKDGSVKLNTNAGTADYEVTIDPNDANYTAGTAIVTVKTADKITAGSDISTQLSTYLAAVRKISSENIALNSGVTADLANLTLSSSLTPKQQDDLKSAYMNSLELLKALDASASVTVHTKLDANSKNTLTGLDILTGGQAAAGVASGDVTYTARDVTPEKPADGQLIEAELSLTSGSSPKQLAAPILVKLTFKAKDANVKGKFQVVHIYTDADSSKSFSTISDCTSVNKSGDEITVEFMAASLGSFRIQYTAPSSGSSSGSSSATPAPDEPQPTPTPALTQSETTWLGGYSAMLQAKSGSTLSLDVSACEYLPGYIIGGVQNTGVTLDLTTPAGKLVLTPAAAKAMNAAYNYTFADAMAIAGKAAASSAATPAPVKDPTATATPTPQPTQAPTPAPTEAPEASAQPTAEPEQEAPAEKSHSVLPIVAAILVIALLAAGGYLAYNSASRKKAVREVYAPTKKAHSNGTTKGKKPNSKTKRR